LSKKIFLDTVNLKKGIHKLRKISGDESFLIKANKVGYESKEILIDESCFSKRRGTVVIKLEKKNEQPKSLNIQTLNSSSISINDTTTRRTLKKINCLTKNEMGLVVIDSEIVNLEMLAKVSTADVEDVTVLKNIEATALYGSIAANGAIIITTKKQKIKKDTLPTPIYELMDEVVVKTGGCIRKNAVITGSVSVVSGEILSCSVSGMNIQSSKKDTIIQKIQNLFSPLKVFPNPVKKGELLMFSFPNKDKFYTIQIINAAGV
jgi:TonB-dependent SusC/RagA subfamily outer membrane receptor